MDRYVYLSFEPSEALDYADALAMHLTEAHLGVWYDRPAAVASRWDKGGLKGAAAVVVVVTPGAERSPRVREELAIARRLGTPILVVLRYGAVPAYLGQVPVEPVLTGAMPSDAFVDYLRGLLASPPPVRRRTGLIASIVAGAVAVLLLCVGGVVVVALNLRDNDEPPDTWSERAAAIDGIEVYRETNPQWLEVPPDGNHREGPINSYPMDPPAGGLHNSRWQNCMGDVYAAEIAKEHAVHSLEHGAVWVTYRPDLPADQVAQLVGRVRDRPFLFLSPYPGLDRPISLQAWGYQLKVDRADDDRIDEFIEALRVNATLEPQAGCGSGVTRTGPEPVPFP
jgi:hypothetical protein